MAATGDGELTPGGTVTHVATCELSVTSSRWDYPERHAAAIERHWQSRVKESPGFFNGAIYLLSAFAFEEGRFVGRLFPAEFKTFLFWRESGEEDPAIYDAFGSALLRSAEGHVLLGRQRPGHVNSGLAYLPGGFIDKRDVGEDGLVDIAASILREVMEETGMGADMWRPSPGFIVTVSGRQISIARELVSPLPSAELLGLIRCRLEADPSSELEDMVLVREPADLEAHAMPDFARLLLGHLFGR